MEPDKKRTKEWDDLGISFGNGGDICQKCIGDPALGEFISSNATETVCSYCGQADANPFASPLSRVVQQIARIINEEFKHDELKAYEAGNGDFYPYYRCFEDLLDRIGFWPEHFRVKTDVASFFNKRTWWWKDTFSDRRECGWKRFCDVVRHSRRYTLWSSTEDIVPEGHPLYMPPSMILNEISAVVAELGLIRELPQDSLFWRVRLGKVSNRPEEFTSPPTEKAVQPNRMSPKGIPMFYGADDFETAALEIAPLNPEGHYVSGAPFKCLRPMRILDLTVDFTRKVGQKSYFAPDGRAWRNDIAFLEKFSRDVSRPLTSDNEFLQQLMGQPQPDVDYVPTQVFTEHVRYHVKWNGQPVDGISYSSSKNRRNCCVLFFDQDDCLKAREGRPQSLEYAGSSWRQVPLPLGTQA